MAKKKKKEQQKNYKNFLSVESLNPLNGEFTPEKAIQYTKLYGDKPISDEEYTQRLKTTRKFVAPKIEQAINKNMEQKLPANHIQQITSENIGNLTKIYQEQQNLPQNRKGFVTSSVERHRNQAFDEWKSKEKTKYREDIQDLESQIKKKQTTLSGMRGNGNILEIAEKTSREIDDLKAQKAEKEEQLKNLNDGETASFLDLTGAAAMSGLANFDASLFSTLNKLPKSLTRLPSSIAGVGDKEYKKRLNNMLGLSDEDTTLSEIDVLQKADDFFANNAEDYNKELEKEIDLMGGGGYRYYGEFMKNLASASPNAVLAWLSGGSSTAGSLSSNSSGIIDTVKNIFKNPNFWSSFAQTYGPSYETAKEDGASDDEATLTAIINSLAGSAVEVGGGIETVPNNPISVKNWIKSAIEEGNEEVIQGVIENLTQKAIYDPDKSWFSLKDNNAVMNPMRAVQEFAGGASVGAVLGGAEMGVAKALNNAQQVTLDSSSGRKATGDGIIQTLVQEGLKAPENSKAWELAQDIATRQQQGKTVSNYQLGMLQDYVSQEQTSAETSFPNTDKISLHPDTYRQTQETLIEMGVPETQAVTQAQAIERLKLGDTSGVEMILQSPEAKQILSRDTGVVFGNTREQGIRAAEQIAGKVQNEIITKSVNSAAMTENNSLSKSVDINETDSMDSVSSGGIQSINTLQAETTPISQEAIKNPSAQWNANGETVQVENIRGVEDGELYVNIRTSSGESSVAKASDLTYQSPEVELVYQTAEQFDTNGAKAFVSGYNPSVNFDSYYRGFAQLYNQGIARDTYHPSASPYTAMLAPQDAQRAYYAGKNDADARFTSASESSKMVTRTAGGVEYTYRKVPDSKVRENAKAIQAEFDKLGITSEVINGAPSASQHGKSITSGGDLTTLKDGHVLIRNDTTLNPKNVAGHEAFHVWIHQNLPEAKAFLNAVSDNLEYSNNDYLNYTDQLIELYFGQEFDPFNVEHQRKLNNEFCAYISGALYENPSKAKEKFSSMFYDWNHIAEQWQAIINSTERNGLYVENNGRRDAQADGGLQRKDAGGSLKAGFSGNQEENTSIRQDDAEAAGRTPSDETGKEIRKNQNGRSYEENVGRSGRVLWGKELRRDAGDQSKGESGYGSDEEGKRRAPSAEKQKSGLVRNEASKKLNGSQRVYYNVLGKLTDTRIIVHDTIQGGKANGYYDPNTGEIHFSLDALDGAYDFVIKHEFTHRLQQLSPEHYRQYFDYVVSYLNQTSPDTFERLLQKQIDGYREIGQKITRQQAMDEVVADASDAFLRDSDAVRELVLQNRTLGQKILDIIRSMMKQIDQYLKNNRNLNADAARLLSQNRQALKQAQRLWMDALLDTQKNTVQQKSGTAGDVRYSLNPNFISEYEAWDKKKSGFSFVVGKTSYALKSIGIKDQTIRWDASKIIKIKNKHPEMTDNVIKQVPNILEYPVIIMKSKNSDSRITMFGEVYDSKQTPVLAVLELYPTNSKGIILDEIKLVSAYGKDNVQNFINSSEILYIDRNKKRINSWLKVNRLQLPLPSSSIDSSNTTIPQTESSVNNSVPKNDKNVRFSLKEFQDNQHDSSKSFAETIDDYNSPITQKDVEILQSIGRKSINEFTSEDIQKTQKWAHKFYKELGTKSPFFRAWFGDWRAYSTKEYISVDHTDHEGVSLGNGRAINKDTNMIMSWNMHNVMGESVIHAVKNKIAPVAINDLNQIVENSVLFDTSVSMLTSKSKMKNTAFMHSFYCVYNYDGKSYLLKLYAEQALSNNEKDIFTRAYELKDIEKVADLPNGVLDGKPPLSEDKSATVNSISKLFEIVNQYDKDFNFHSANPVLLNENGTPKIFYHGTPNGTFNEFKNWQYFTENQEYADVYQEQGASSNGYKKTADNPHTYAVYLTGKKVFDTRNSNEAKIFENEFYGRWGNGAPLSEKGLPDWTDGDDLIEFFDEKGYDYDIILLDEGATGGYGDTVNSRGISIVVKNPTQIKSATDNIGTFDGNNPDIRFSLKNVSKLDYETLVSKPDMKITPITYSQQSELGKSRSEIVNTAVKNAKMFGKENQNGNAVVHVKDVDTDIIISKAAIRHGLDRRKAIQTPIIEHIGKVLANSILINELMPKNQNADSSYILLGIAKINTENSYSLVRSVVNQFTNELETIDVLYSVDIKKESGASKEARASGAKTLQSLTDSKISIANFLDIVKDTYPDILPQSVLKHYEMERPEGIFTHSLKFSLKNVSKLDYDNLVKENKKQKEMISLLKEQFQVTKGIKWDKSSIDRTAQRILKQYDSTYSAQDLSENLTRLYEYIANSPDVNADEAHSVVTAMSKSVLEHSKKLDETMYREYKDLRDHIRKTKLTLSDADKADLDRVGGYHQFRRDNFGRINLTNEGTPVDAFYQELEVQYPEFFAGEKITHPADQLIRISDVLDTIKPVYVNPYGMNIDESAGILANEIMESYFDIPQAKPTYADLELQKRKKLKLEYQKKIREIKAEYREKYEEKLKEINRQNLLKVKEMKEELKKTSAADKAKIRKLENQIERLKQYNSNISHAKSVAMSVSSAKSISVPVKKSGPSVPMKPTVPENHSYQKLTDTYGAIPKGESPVRDVDVPVQTDENTKVRRFARTAMEAGATPDEMISEFEQEIMDGTFNYNPISDKASEKEANLVLSKHGFDGALQQWKGVLKNGKRASKDDIVLAEKLYMRAAKEGNYKLAMELAAEIAEEGTRAGQTVQAMRLLKKMSGEGQLVYMERVVDRMNQDLKSRREKGKVPYLEIPENKKETLLQSKTREEIDQITEEIYQHLASQLPATFADKWNAWRYFSMLGNPRTHVRNLTGNAVFLPAVKMKNLIATGIEAAYQKTGGNIERTKTLKATRENLYFAKKDFEMMADIISGGGKMNPSDVIRDYQKVFRFTPLEKIRKLNFNAMEMEDRIFLKQYYVSALAGYMTANQIDPKAFVSQQILERARNYAIKEAQKATYRDASKVANMLQQVSRSNRPLGLLVEGVLPFKKTPINILKRGIEYSPAGLIYSLTAGTKKVKSGDITASEYIDGISAGLSGTVLFALGAFLQSLGVLRGGEDDEKKKEQFDRNMGYQPYSLQIGDFSYTIDWMAPSSLPLFVGARVFETLTEEQEDYSVSRFIEDLQLIAEPILSLSMLSGLNDILSSVSYGDNGIADIAGNVIDGYFGQAVPTFLGQIARTADGTRRITYTDKNQDIPSDIQYFLKKNQNKIPGASMLSQPYIDLWGQEDTQENVLIRAFENFFSPGYISFTDDSHKVVEQELVRIYEEIGDVGLFPSKAPKYFTVDGQRKDLTAEEYTAFAKAKGQKAYSLLEELMQTEKYQSSSSEEKAELIADIYEYATVYGKTQVSDYSTNGWKAKALEAGKNGESELDVILNRKRK